MHTHARTHPRQHRRAIEDRKFACITGVLDLTVSSPSLFSVTHSWKNRPTKLLQKRDKRGGRRRRRSEEAEGVGEEGEEKEEEKRPGHSSSSNRPAFHWHLNSNPTPRRPAGSERRFAGADVTVCPRFLEPRYRACAPDFTTGSRFAYSVV